WRKHHVRRLQILCVGLGRGAVRGRHPRTRFQPRADDVLPAGGRAMSQDSLAAGVADLARKAMAKGMAVDIFHGWCELDDFFWPMATPVKMHSAVYRKGVCVKATVEYADGSVLKFAREDGVLSTELVP